MLVSVTNPLCNWLAAWCRAAHNTCLAMGMRDFLPAGEEGQHLLYVLSTQLSLGQHLLCTHSPKMLFMGREEESCLCPERQERFLFPWKQSSSLLVEDTPPPTHTHTGMRQAGKQAREAEAGAERVLSRAGKQWRGRYYTWGERHVLRAQSKNSVVFVAPNSCCFTGIQPLAWEQPGGEDLSHQGTAVLECASPSYSYSDSAWAFPSLKCSML